MLDANPKRVDSSLVDHFGALQWAAGRGQAEIVRLLIARKADVNRLDQSGNSALNLANRLDVVRALVENGADVNIEAKGGYTPLHDAIGGGHMDAARYLVAHGATVDLFSATGLGDLNRLKKEFDKDPTSLQVKLNGCSLMYWAMDAATVKFLVAHKVDVNDQGGNGITPLHSVAQKSAEAAEALLENGANPNAQDKEGWTPLHNVLRLEKEDAIKVLIKHGADPTIKNNNGESPLNWAIRDSKSQPSIHTRELLHILEAGVKR